MPHRHLHTQLVWWAFTLCIAATQHPNTLPICGGNLTVSVLVGSTAQPSPNGSQIVQETLSTSWWLEHEHVKWGPPTRCLRLNFQRMTQTQRNKFSLLASRVHQYYILNTQVPSVVLKSDYSVIQLCLASPLPRAPWFPAHFSTFP